MKSYFKSHQSYQSHPIYRGKGIYRVSRLNSAKENMPSDVYKLFCDEVDKMFEKWVLLYDIAMQSPEAFKKLNAECTSRELFTELEKSVIADRTDELKCKYVEAKKFIMDADDLYPQEYNFSIRIQSLAIGLAVFLDKAITRKMQIQEVNKQWREVYSPQHFDNLDCKEEPLRKRLKKDNEEEKTEEKKSVSWGLFG